MNENPENAFAALGLRTPIANAATALGYEEPTDPVTAWTHRGAPHRHRRDDLAACAAASSTATPHGSSGGIVRRFTGP